MAKKKTTKKKTSRKKGTSKKKKRSGGGVAQISARAKKIRKNGEAWTAAIKRASAQLKKEGKI